MDEIGGRSRPGVSKRSAVERINAFIHIAVAKASYSANFILAALMILIAASHTYDVLSGISQPHISSFIGYAIIIACGAAIILDRNRDLPRSVGFYAIGLGFYRFFTSASHLVPHNDMNLLFYAIMALGLNMALSGRAYILGKSRARLTMMGGSIAFLLLALVMLTYVYSGTRDIVYVIETQRNTFLLALMYFVFILILDSEKLRNRDWLEVHSRTLDGIRRTYLLQEDASISLSDAESLAGGGWATVDDGGPVESEISVGIRNGSGFSCLTAQRWKGSDDVHITLADHCSGTIMQASRFAVNGILLKDGRLEMEAVTGDVFSICVEEGSDALQE